MIEQIIWLNFIVSMIAIPSMSIMSILFHKQHRTRGSLLLAFGFTTVLIGMIIELIFPQTFETMEEATKVLENSGPPLSWFIDDIVNIIGTVITVFGFGLVVTEDKKV